MKTYLISITANLTKEGYGKKVEKELRLEIDWSTLLAYWQTAKTYCMGRLYNLVTKYDNYQTKKQKERKAQWPKHTLFCECRRCLPSMKNYKKAIN